MITISTRDYTTEQLKYLAEGLSYVANEYLIARNVKNIRTVHRLAKPVRYVMI